MYTLHYTIGVNWDIYVPWTGKGLNSERHIDNIIKCPDYRERCHHFGRGASGEEFHCSLAEHIHTYLCTHFFMLSSDAIATLQLEPQSRRPDSLIYTYDLMCTWW